MEGLAEKMEGLRKKLKKLKPESIASQETLRELRSLQRLLRTEAGDLRKAAARRLPYDIDQNLSPRIGDLAELSEDMARELEKLERQKDLLNKDLAKQLEALQRRMAGGRQLYDRSAMVPLEFLEAVFPLMVDEDRFAVLVLRQQDLADRLATMKGHDGEDNPAIKGQMRDYEHEQRLICEELASLLDDIESHATRLPDVPELKELRETAMKFVKDVRASGAAAAMAEAEAALAEFAGTRGHEKAKEAADILAKFLKKCQGMGGMAVGVLGFQPGLCDTLGNTIGQLLGEMGGMGGMGMGGMGYFGLYGSLDALGGQGRGGDAENKNADASPSDHFASRGKLNNNPDAVPEGEEGISGAAAGSGEGAMPLRYRRQIGQYFQRLIEESQ